MLNYKFIKCPKVKEHSCMMVYTNDLNWGKGRQFREGFPRLSSKGEGAN